jgi:hypothetical protein
MAVSFALAGPACAQTGMPVRAEIGTLFYPPSRPPPSYDFGGYSWDGRVTSINACGFLMGSRPSTGVVLRVRREGPPLEMTPTRTLVVLEGVSLMFLSASTAWHALMLPAGSVREAHVGGRPLALVSTNLVEGCLETKEYGRLRVFVSACNAGFLAFGDDPYGRLKTALARPASPGDPGAAAGTPAEYAGDWRALVEGCLGAAGERLRDILDAQEVRYRGIKFPEDGRGYLDLAQTTMADLSPLRGVSLAYLDLRDTPVRDLGPLHGMPLRELYAGGSQAADLTPLRGTPLERCDLARTAVTNLAPLAGLPLTHLSLAAVEVTEVTALHGMRLTILDLTDTGVQDLSPLQGMPLTRLRLGGTRVTDLSPLRGMPLGALDLGRTKVADLSPLKGLPLQTLQLNGTPVTNLAALAGMRLSALDLRDMSVADLSPLRGMKTLADLRGAPTDSLWAPIARALEQGDRAAARAEAGRLVNEWQSVPAMAGLVRRARKTLEEPEQPR